MRIKRKKKDEEIFTFKFRENKAMDESFESHDDAWKMENYI